MRITTPRDLIPTPTPSPAQPPYLSRLSTTQQDTSSPILPRSSGGGAEQREAEGATLAPPRSCASPAPGGGGVRAADGGGSSLLPRPDGGGVRAADGGGSSCAYPTPSAGANKVSGGGSPTSTPTSPRATPHSPSDNPSPATTPGIQIPTTSPSPILPRSSGGGAEQREAEGATLAPPPSCASTAPGGGGVRAADGGGSPCAYPTPRAGADEVSGGGSPSPPLPPDGRSLMADGLLKDLLDPTNTPLQLCLIHDITLDQLEAIVTSTAFKHAAAQLQTITNARTEAIETNTHLQTQSLNRAIANDAYLAANDMDQAAATRDPKRAAIKARYLETARKANTPLLPRPDGGGAEQSEPEGVSFSPSTAASPGHPGEVPAQPAEGAICVPSPTLVDPPLADGGGLERSETEGVLESHLNSSTLGARTRGKAAQCGQTPDASPSPSLAASPGHPGEVPTKSAEGVLLQSPPPSRRGRCPRQRTEGVFPCPSPRLAGRCPPKADGGVFISHLPSGCHGLLAQRQAVPPNQPGHPYPQTPRTYTLVLHHHSHRRRIRLHFRLGRRRRRRG